MTRILVLFGTTDGQTAKVARFITDELRSAGVAADLVEAGRQDADPEDYDAVIVAASIHAGGFQRPVVRWARDHRAGLQGRPTLFLAVCLAILQQDPAVRGDLHRVVNQFVAKTGWRPAEVEFVAGALKYRSYGWFRRMLMRWIAGRAGGSTDTSKDHEYTDWAALRVRTLGFLAALREAEHVAH